MWALKNETFGMCVYSEHSVEICKISCHLHLVKAILVYYKSPYSRDCEIVKFVWSWKFFQRLISHKIWVTENCSNFHTVTAEHLFPSGSHTKMVYTMLQKFSKCEVKDWLCWNLIILPSATLILREIEFWWIQTVQKR